MPPRGLVLFVIASTVGACSLVYDASRLVDGPPSDAGVASDAPVEDAGIGVDGSSARTCPVSNLPNGFCDDFDDDVPLAQRWTFDPVDVLPVKIDKELSIAMDLVVDAQATRSFIIKRLDEPLGSRVKVSCRIRILSTPSDTSSVELNTIYIQKLTIRPLLRNTGEVTLQAADSSKTYFSRTLPSLPMNEWRELAIVFDRSRTPRHVTALYDGKEVMEADIEGPINSDDNAGFRAGVSASNAQHGGRWDIRLDDFRVEGER